MRGKRLKPQFEKIAKDQKCSIPELVTFINQRKWAQQVKDAVDIEYCKTENERKVGQDLTNLIDQSAYVVLNDQMICAHAHQILCKRFCTSHERYDNAVE